VTASRPMPEQIPSRTGVWVGIAAITMSFGAYTSAMLVREGSGMDWQRIHLPAILYWNTLTLLVSSGTLEMARRRLAPPVSADAARAGRGLLAATLALGVLFVAGQVAAWRALAAQGVYLASGPAASFFYVFTVLHALHLLGGVVGLGIAGARVRADVGVRALTSLGSASVYWHFMGVLWLYLLAILTIKM